MESAGLGQDVEAETAVISPCCRACTWTGCSQARPCGFGHTTRHHVVLTGAGYSQSGRKAGRTRSSSRGWEMVAAIVGRCAGGKAGKQQGKDSSGGRGSGSSRGMVAVVGRSAVYLIHAPPGRGRYDEAGSRALFTATYRSWETEGSSVLWSWASSTPLPGTPDESHDLYHQLHHMGLGGAGLHATTICNWGLG